MVICKERAWSRLACVLAGVTASGMPLREHRIVIFGAGTAGVGIADQIYDALRRAGFSEAEARARFWLLDKARFINEKCLIASFSNNLMRVRMKKSDIGHYAIHLYWSLRCR